MAPFFLSAYVARSFNLELAGCYFIISSCMWTNFLSDPGFCNTNLRMIHVTVDLSRPENQNPQPELEENEFIETFSVPLKDLWGQCVRFEEQGYAIDARVGTLAEGIELAKRWKL
jgi:ADP-ribose pyrophosphatase